MCKTALLGSKVIFYNETSSQILTNTLSRCRKTFILCLLLPFNPCYKFQYLVDKCFYFISLCLFLSISSSSSKCKTSAFSYGFPLNQGSRGVRLRQLTELSLAHEENCND